MRMARTSQVTKPAKLGVMAFPSGKLLAGTAVAALIVRAIRLEFRLQESRRHGADFRTGDLFAQRPQFLERRQLRPRARADLSADG